MCKLYKEFFNLQFVIIMKKTKYKFKAEVWLYPGNAGWHFVSVPKKESGEIKKVFIGLSRGWGSLPVEVTVGRTCWKTSIFPDKKSETYLLPLKVDIRKKEDIKNGNIVEIAIKIIV